MPTCWKPTSWQEFRRAYWAGDCHVEFLHNTLGWAHRKGWKLKPDLGAKRKDAIGVFMLLSLIQVVGVIAGG